MWLPVGEVMLSNKTFSLEGSIVSPDMTKRDTRLTGLFEFAGFQSVGHTPAFLKV